MQFKKFKICYEEQGRQGSWELIILIELILIYIS